MAPLSGTLSVLLLSLVLRTVPEKEAVHVFAPGQEVRVEALLAPDDATTFTYAGWHIEKLSAGPECRFDIVFHHEDERSVRIVVLPSEMPDVEGSFSINVDRSREDVTVRILVEAIGRRLRTNDPGAFFAAACMVILRGTTTSQPNSLDPSRFIESTKNRTMQDAWSATHKYVSSRLTLILTYLVFCVGLVLGMRYWRRSRRDALHAWGLVDAKADLSDAWIDLSPWVVGGIIACTLVPRALLLDWLPIGAHETNLYYYARLVPGTLTGETDLAGGWLCYHAPLHPLIVHVWTVIGDWIGVGGEIWWLRTPNLLPALASSLLLLRLGRVLDRRGAGVGAALLFALTPEIISASVGQHSYIWESSAVLFLLERSATIWRTGRPADGSFVVALGVAPWLGHLTLFAVGPTLLGLYLSTRDPVQRRLLRWSVVVFAVLFLPIAQRAAMGLWSYAGVVVVGAEDAAVEVPSRFGHGPLFLGAETRADAVMAFVTDHTERLFGPQGALFSALGVAFLIWRRWRLTIVLVMPLVLFASASGFLFLYNKNLGSWTPFLITASLLGWHEALERLRLEHSGLRASLVLLFFTLTSQGSDITDSIWTRSRDDQGGFSATTWTQKLTPGRAELCRPDEAAAVPDLSWVLSEPRWKKAPIVFVTSPQFLLYELCDERESVSGVSRCLEYLGRDPCNNGVYHGETQGHQAWGVAPFVGKGTEAPCDTLLNLLDRSPWGAAPVLVLANPDLSKQAGLFQRCRDLQDHLYGRCERWVTPRGLLILGCADLSS